MTPGRTLFTNQMTSEGGWFYLNLSGCAKGEEGKLKLCHYSHFIWVCCIKCRWNPWKIMVVMPGNKKKQQGANSLGSHCKQWLFNLLKVIFSHLESTQKHRYISDPSLLSESASDAKAGLFFSLWPFDVVSPTSVAMHIIARKQK